MFIQVISMMPDFHYENKTFECNHCSDTLTLLRIPLKPLSVSDESKQVDKYTVCTYLFLSFILNVII